MVDPVSAQMGADPIMSYVGGTLGTVGGGVVLWYLRAIFEQINRLTDGHRAFMDHFQAQSAQETRTLDHLSMSIQNHADTTSRLERTIERLADK